MRAIVLSLVFLAACTAKPEHRLAPRSADLQTLRSEHRAAERNRDLARMDEPAAAASAATIEALRPYDVKSYALDAHFDWDQEALLGTVTIALDLKDQAATELALDSRVEAIDNVTVNSRTASSFIANAEDGTLTISLANLPEAERGQTVALAIRYKAVAREPKGHIGSFNHQALRAVKQRPGDPIAARAAHTMSEPRSASQWMPCDDRPIDRATFAAQFTLEGQDALIANGDLLADKVDADGRRIMSYATSYSLPTYLMAFAVGEFAEASSTVGDLPIAVWSRRGLPVDTNGMLKELTHYITRFQELVGPYAFEKYAIVLLPEFGGGEEHAGITFQTEMNGPDTTSGSDRTMIAHELAHQWFGDYMTVANWDDLWIKEGMATLLESESTRSYADTNGAGRLFGSNFWIEAGDAIIDPALAPEAKYTSGPYGRSAWLLTQMRASLGDSAFFGALRGILKRHAYGNISTDEFLAEMRDAGLTDDFIARARNALKAHKMPTLNLKESGEASAILSIEDPEHALVLPLEIRLTSVDGATNALTLDANGTATLPLDGAGFTAFDPLDVHGLPFFAVGDYELLDRVETPRGAVDTDRFLKLSANVQRRMLYNGAWLASPADAAKIIKGAAAEETKADALAAACRNASTAPETDRDAWRATLLPALAAPPLAGLTSWYGQAELGSCFDVVSADLFLGTSTLLQNDPSTTLVTPAYLSYLTQLPFGAEKALAIFGPVAEQGASPRMRATAIRGLANYSSDEKIAKLSETAKAALAKFIRSVLSSNMTSEGLRSALEAPVKLADVGALPALAHVAAEASSTRARVLAVCNARDIAKEDDAAWQQFRGELTGVELVPSVQKAVDDKAVCEANTD